MLQSFNEIVSKAKSLGKITISVAVAQDLEVLEALKAAEDAGLAKCILVGDAEQIKPLVAKVGLSADTKIIHEPDIDKAALEAVKKVSSGEAQIYMKGLLNSSNFLRAALNAEFGLRSGRILSHFVALQIPGVDKLVFKTDGGMNIAPNLQEKKGILLNAIEALKNMGIENPNIAALAANEQVNPKMQATVDAKGLVDMAAAGELPGCVIEGPIAMDVAASAEAAKHKGIPSKIAGNVDIYLVPTIEAGNIFGKIMVHFVKAKNAGIILGATNPIVMVSRSDTPEAKFNSIALACIALKR
ncbi:MAG: phosphotransacetylase [Firmicutes bacterium]|nr:phosphotransacetylase [Bacillota bacterium]